MKDYYTILGVHASASQAEIKSAYRNLAQQLHPDVNPEPDALEKIKAINEAYEVLGDAAKRQAYDYKLQYPFHTEAMEQPPQHRDPAYRRRSTVSQNPEVDEQTTLMKKSLTAIRWMAVACLTFCGVLVVDYFMPSRIHRELIVSIEPVYKTYRTKLFHDRDKVITDSGREITILKDETEFFKPDSVLVVVESPLLNIPFSIKNASGSHALTNLATIYANFRFLPVLLLVASLTGVVVKNGSVDFHFSLGLVILALFMFNLIFLLNG